MIVIRSINDVSRIPGPRAVALGFFDGVHLGHQRIIDDLIIESSGAGFVPTCLTFDPHPLCVLKSPAAGPKMLTSLDEKLGLFESLGVQVVVVIEFDRGLSMLTPHDFSRSVLKGALDARLVACGFNFSFGKGGAGGPGDLVRFGTELGFKVKVHAPVLVDGVAVSSTAIRDAVSRGDVLQAREMLGRPYSLEGEVVRGDGRGASPGMHTANLHVAADRLLPANGVYATMSRTALGKFPSVTNVGFRPTFPVSSISVETHILGFSGDIYGTRMGVAFLRRLRGERLFRNGIEMAEQIRRDAALALEISAGEAEEAPMPGARLTGGEPG